jgi:aspartyl-tRNA(Asn)/glutamyl-tRNA(Gln) amidotransferase subunit A
MYRLSAKKIRENFLSGAASAEEIATYFLNRIEALNPQIAAFLALFRKRALEKAKQLDEKKRKRERIGKLAAIPIALKDNMHVQGELTTCGSKFLRNYKAVFDATVTRLLEQEDALILGKTNLDEFAMGSSTEHSAFQLTRNPWNLECVAGGSSGGSAAAVAARLTPIALGCAAAGGSLRHCGHEAHLWPRLPLWPCGLCLLIRSNWANGNKCRRYWAHHGGLRPA